MPQGYVILDVFCYRRHGYMPEQVVPEPHIKGEWAICPRCALGADIDPRCANEIHMARIVQDSRNPTATKTVGKFASETLMRTAKKLGTPGWGYKDAVVTTAERTLADDRARDALRRRQDAEARAVGYTSNDAKWADCETLDHPAIIDRYNRMIRSTE